MAQETNHDSDRIRACAVARSLDAYRPLISEMQSLFGDQWGGLDLKDALPVLGSVHADQIEFLFLVLDRDDVNDIPAAVRIVEKAKAKNIAPVLLNNGLDESRIQPVLMAGVDYSLTYPMEPGRLASTVQTISAGSAGSAAAATAPQAEAVPQPAPSAEAQPAPEPAQVQPAAAAPQAPPVQEQQGLSEIDALRAQIAQAQGQEAAPAAPVEAAPQPAVAPQAPAEQAPAAIVPPPAPQPAPVAPRGGRNGLIFPVYGLSGGVGASVFASNLAWELLSLGSKSDKRVCVIDLSLQYGSISTYLDVPRSDSSLELLMGALSADEQTLEAAMRMHNKQLAVFPAPTDAVPLDIVGPAEIGAVLDLAAQQYDFVIVDLPNVLTTWSETILSHAKLFFAIGELEMRTAQNALRFLRALKADDLPYEKVQFILNRAPKRTDLNGRSRIKRMSDSLNVEFRWLLPDGGKHVLAACDQGETLAVASARNPLRKEIRKIAEAMYESASDSDDVKASA